MSITQSTQVRGITLWQPWASLIALGLKQYETRSWSTRYRGKLLIHAASKAAHKISHEEINLAWDACDKAGKDRFSREVLDFTRPPYGCIVAIADLTDCLSMTTLPGGHPQHLIQIGKVSELERAVGDWQPGRFAWKLENVQAIKPVSCKGKQGLWVPNSELIERLGV